MLEPRPITQPLASAQADLPRPTMTQPGARGGRRVVVSEGGFDLDQLHNVMIVPLPRCVGAYISVTPAAGTWGTAVVAVQIPAVGTYLDFGTAKGLTAGGGLISLTEEDCLGLPEIAIVVTTKEGAFSRAAITVQIEEAGD